MLGPPHRRARLLTERTQEPTPASAPKAPGRLGRRRCKGLGGLLNSGAGILNTAVPVLQANNVIDLRCRDLEDVGVFDRGEAVPRPG